MMTTMTASPNDKSESTIRTTDGTTSAATTTSSSTTTARPSMTTTTTTTTTRNRNSNTDDDHRYNSSSRRRIMNSIVPGESEVEQIASRIEQRRAERIPITFSVQLQLLRDCRTLAISHHSEKYARIPLSALLSYRIRLQSLSANIIRQKKRRRLWKWCGMPSDVDQLLFIVDRAIHVMTKDPMAGCGSAASSSGSSSSSSSSSSDDDDEDPIVDEEQQLDDSLLLDDTRGPKLSLKPPPPPPKKNDTALSSCHWFYYRDFVVSHTKTISRWPWMRTNLRKAMTAVLLFYLATPIFFCCTTPLLLGSGSAPSDVCAPGRGPLEPGWITALYFASATISSVGYGDVAVSQHPWWQSFIGSLYMLIATVVAVVAFSTAADSTISPFHDTIKSIVRRWEHSPTTTTTTTPTHEKVIFLHQRLRRVKIVRLTEVFVEIFLFVFIGVVVSQICVALDNVKDDLDDNDKIPWNWMTSLYWAIQTTTTIGYGDLTPPYGLRIFNIFYLLVATYVVGSSFGRMGSLKEELSELKRRHAWDHRPVTRRYVRELKAYDTNGDDDDNHDKVDQFEFMVASLIMLGKIDSSDLRLVMDKFRKLAGTKGYISVDDPDVTAAASIADVETADELKDEALLIEQQDDSYYSPAGHHCRAFWHEDFDSVECITTTLSDSSAKTTGGPNESKQKLLFSQALL